ncbi:complement C1s subcomponent-like isoform X2 [Protopterus annectens]|uniref:complement C1s subcomponent-like isoform X2 n=1 Tax=Protopterus annectens TaxID=7888 RepID=UPI001CF99759|nr:complement C1s subcomponent-like isoform X2 [Protopterus annectens]
MWIIFWLLLCLTASTKGSDTSMYGEIHSPNYPHGYPNNVHQSWDISVPKGFKIHINFMHVDIEASPGCGKDYMKVADEDQDLFIICGRLLMPLGKIPSLTEIESPSNKITVTFHSDSSNEDSFTGFMAYYVAIDINECENSGKDICNHYCNNYYGGFRCGCHYGYFLQEDQTTCTASKQCPESVIPDSRMQPFLSKHLSKIIMNVTCLEGYEMYHNKARITAFSSECLENGTWTNSFHECKPVDCGPPEQVDNSVVVYLTESDVDTFGAKIQYMCEEPYYKMDGKADVCGNVTNPPQPIQRIIKGEFAEEGNFPWQVYFEIPRAGGALIGEQWVLTSATVAEQDGLTMYIGTINVGREALKAATEIKPEKIFLHPSYNIVTEGERRYNYDNDIALIKLKDKVKMGYQISPICIPNEGEEFELLQGRMGFISGWGRTEKGYLSQRLRYAQIPVENMNTCKHHIFLNKNPETKKLVFTDNMFCGGLKGIDSCQGDNGGAYAFKSDDSTYFVGGIVSWGVECGSYGFYTKMKNYIEWINKTITENSHA